MQSIDYSHRLTFLDYFSREHAKENLPDLLMVMNLSIDNTYVPLCPVVASKLRAAELTGRKEVGLTTSTLQNSIAMSCSHNPQEFVN